MIDIFQQLDRNGGISNHSMSLVTVIGVIVITIVMMIVIVLVVTCSWVMEIG